MNKARRKELSEIVSELMDLRDRLETVKDQEDECYANLPDSLQESEKGESMQEAVDALDEAISSLDDAIESINGAINV